MASKRGVYYSVDRCGLLSTKQVSNMHIRDDRVGPMQEDFTCSVQNFNRQ